MSKTPIQFHKVNTGNTPSTVAGDHVYFEPKGIYVNNANGEMEKVAGNYDAQINVLSKCEHVDLVGKSLLEYAKSLPFGSHKCIQFQGATDTPTTQWYYADIFVHVYSTDFFHINLYSLQEGNTMFYGTCCNGNFSGWFDTSKNGIAIKQLQNGADILAEAYYNTNLRLLESTRVRILNSATSPYALGNDDFIYEIIKTSDNSCYRIIAHDMRSTKTFINSRINGVYTGWQQQATTSQVQELQTQLTAISNMLMESANLKEE
nr:MAG TPA: hypothetical protein [Caudoviricetes sp.]